MDYKVETIDREFGTVIIDRDGAQMDLGLEVAKAGWAKVLQTHLIAVNLQIQDGISDEERHNEPKFSVPRTE